PLNPAQCPAPHLITTNTKAPHTPFCNSIDTTTPGPGKCHSRKTVKLKQKEGERQKRIMPEVHKVERGKGNEAWSQAWEPCGLTLSTTRTVHAKGNKYQRT